MAGTLPVPDKPRVTVPDKSRNSGPHCHRPDPNANLPFLKDDVYTDVILNIEGKKLFINRSILGYASPYFHKILGNGHNGGSPERKGGKTEIKIVDKSYQDFVDLLSYLHPAVGKDLTEKTALNILPLANEFDMLAVKESCEKQIIQFLNGSAAKLKDTKSPPGNRKRKDGFPGYLTRCLQAADAGESKSVIDVCVKIYATTDIPLKDLKANPNISDQIKARIYEKRMDMASDKLTRVSVELDRERREKDMYQHMHTDENGKVIYYSDTGYPPEPGSPKSPQLSRKSLKRREDPPKWKI